MASPVTQHRSLWANPPAQTGVPGSSESCPSAKPETSARINPYNEPDFLAACRSGDLQWVKEQLSRDASLARQEYRSGRGDCMVFPLHIACQEGHDDIVRVLLDQGVNVNVALSSPSRKTPLVTAVAFGHSNVVERLLQHPDININSVAGAYTPLLTAVYSGRGNIVKQLLKQPGIDVNAAGSQGFTPLYVATLKSFTEIVDLLASQPGIDINAGSTDCTALYRASHDGHKELVERLLQHPNINVNAPGAMGTPLLIAARRGHSDVVRLLLAHSSIDVNCRFKGDYTALQAAAQQGHTDIVMQLLAMKNIDIDAARANGSTALSLANRHQHRDIVLCLARARGERDYETDNQIAFKYAMWNGNLLWLRDVLAQQPELADQKFAVNETGSKYYPLFIATTKHQQEIVRLLLEKGAGVNAVDEYGVTALWVAASNGFSDISSLLLGQRSVRVDAARKDGATPLYVAAQNGHKDVVEQLLAKGADPKLKRKINWLLSLTPLQVAKQNNHLEVVDLLRKELNPRKVTENTPLLNTTVQ